MSSKEVERIVDSVMPQIRNLLMRVAQASYERGEEAVRVNIFSAFGVAEKGRVIVDENGNTKRIITPAHRARLAENAEKARAAKKAKHDARKAKQSETKQRTPSQKQKQANEARSLKMKMYWAEKRAKEGKTAPQPVA